MLPHTTYCALVLFAGLSATVQAATVDYQLEPTHVDMLFSVNHLGFSWKHGSFRQLSGTLSYDAQHPEASRVAITIRADSIDTGHAARDSDLKSDHFFDVQKFPEIRFQSTKIERDASRGFVVWGELTLHGVTAPIKLQVRMNGVGQNRFDHKPTIGFSGVGQLKRSDFGMSGFLPAVGDQVKIEFDIEFNRNADAGSGGPP
jgi:polyisoprenoid-binding protein YceI